MHRLRLRMIFIIGWWKMKNSLFSFLHHLRYWRGWSESAGHICGGFLFCFLPLLASCLSTDGGNPREENLPPVIEDVTLQVEKSGTEYLIKVKAEDPEARTLAYEYLVDDKVHQSWTGESRCAWKPDNSESCYHNIEVRARDPEGLTVSRGTAMTYTEGLPAAWGFWCHQITEDDVRIARQSNVKIAVIGGAIYHHYGDEFNSTEKETLQTILGWLKKYEIKPYLYWIAAYCEWEIANKYPKSEIKGEDQGQAFMKISLETAFGRNLFDQLQKYKETYGLSGFYFDGIADNADYLPTPDYTDEDQDKLFQTYKDAGLDFFGNINHKYIGLQPRWFRHVDSIFQESQDLDAIAGIAGAMRKYDKPGYFMYNVYVEHTPFVTVNPKLLSACKPQNIGVFISESTRQHSLTKKRMFQRLPTYRDGFTSYSEGSNGFPTWLPYRGDWRVRNGSYTVRQVLHDMPISVTGHEDWTDYEISTKLKIGSEIKGNDEIAGLAFRFRYNGVPPDHYYLLCVSKKRNDLSFRDSRNQLIGEASYDLEYDRWYNLKLRVQGQRFTAFIDDRPVLEAMDERYKNGMAGVFSWDCGDASFDDFTVERF